jgi:uncharacterized protein
VRLFGRSREQGNDQLRLYYASDIHGTEVLWKKFLNAPGAYNAKVLVMGGDITGKMVIPIIQNETGDGWTATFQGRQHTLQSEPELEKLEHRIRGNGMYPYRTTTTEVKQISALTEPEREKWFEGVMLNSFKDWLELADERLAGTGIRCFVMPGNDDPPSLEPVIETATQVESCDEKWVTFNNYQMLSLGYSNITPWNSPRELDENTLYERISELADQLEDHTQAIWNIHVPPHDSQLDTAAELDQDFNVILIGKTPHLIPVGSTAVRETIEKYQPLAALHGHIHESPGATRIGRTLCINPGSDYATGRITGCLINLKHNQVNHQFVTG